MGDGAFSNVYRAKDTTGQYDEVAIKVVRKFEMNSNQVCSVADASISLDPFPPFPFLSFLPPKPFIPLHLETCANKGAS